MLTVIFILGIFMSTLVLALNTILRWPSNSRDRADTVQTAAISFGLIQRDLRETAIQYTFLCTSSATPTCSQATNPVIAIATAADARGDYYVATDGTPAWRGFVLYWVSGGVLYRSYQPVQGMTPPTAAQAAQAASSANVAAPSASEELVASVQGFSVALQSAAAPPNVSVTLTTGITNHASTQHTFSIDVVPHNSD
jgi:hypothetical protein